MNQFQVNTVGQVDLVGASKRMVNLVFTKQPEPVGDPVVFERFCIVNNKIPRSESYRGIGLIALSQRVYMTGTVVGFSNSKLDVDFEIQYDNLVSTPLAPNCKFKVRGALNIQQTAPGQYKLTGFSLQHDDWYRIDHTWLLGVALPKLYINIIDVKSNVYPESQFKNDQLALTNIDYITCLQPVKELPMVCVGQKSKLSQTYTTAQQQIEDTKLQRLTQTFTSLEEDVKKLADCNSQKTTTVTASKTVEQQVKALPANIALLQSQYDPIKAKLDNIKVQQSTISNSIKQLQSEVQTLDSNLALSATDKLSTEEQNRALQSKITENQQQLTSVKQQLQTTTADIDNAMNQFDPKGIQYVNTNIKIQSILQDLQKADAILKDFKDKQTTLNQAVALLKELNNLLLQIQSEQERLVQSQKYQNIFNQSTFKQYADFIAAFLIIIAVGALVAIIVTKLSKQPAQQTFQDRQPSTRL